MEGGEHRLQAPGVVSPLDSVSIRVDVAHEDHGAMRVVGGLSEVKSEVCHHQALGVGDLVVELGWASGRRPSTAFWRPHQCTRSPVDPVCGRKLHCSFPGCRR